MPKKVAPGEEEWQEKVVQIRRVTKVVRGGKKMGFRVVMAVGNSKGKVGVGIGKSNEISAAIRKGAEEAKKHLIDVLFSGSTIPHEVYGNLGASKVLIKPAPRGTGVIAGGAIRTVLELAGVKDVVAKSLGSSNAVNTAKAAIAGLLLLKDLEEEKKVRGKEFTVSSFEEEEA